MVDDSTQILVNQDIVFDEQDNSHVDIAAEIWWSNMLAVVKLRQKGTTMLSKLQRGVFRHMLEYKFPKQLYYRYCDPYDPIEWEQYNHFPDIEKLSYDNYLVAVNYPADGYIFQMTLADGAYCGT